MIMGECDKPNFVFFVGASVSLGKQKEAVIYLGAASLLRSSSLPDRSEFFGRNQFSEQLKGGLRSYLALLRAGLAVPLMLPPTR
jgi:hypothetical protein